MASLTIRNLEEETKARLRRQAALHGRSMEEEVRNILRLAVSSGGSGADFAERIHQRFAAQGVDALRLPPRRPARLPEPLDE
jgi:plasmid stability protein